MAAMQAPVAPCGHSHQLWGEHPGQRNLEPALWRVVEAVETRTPEWEKLTLEPGTLLRHDQSDWTQQGCAGCEATFVWERFAVLDGAHASKCVEFSIIEPAPGQTAVPAEVQPA